MRRSRRRYASSPAKSWPWRSCSMTALVAVLAVGGIRPAIRVVAHLPSNLLESLYDKYCITGSPSARACARFGRSPDNPVSRPMSCAPPGCSPGSAPGCSARPGRGRTRRDPGVRGSLTGWAPRGRRHVMRIKVPHLPRVRFPRRRTRRRSADGGTPGTLRAGILRVPRRIALALVAAASLVSFAESYRGLYLWAHRHGLAGLWAHCGPCRSTCSSRSASWRCSSASSTAGHRAPGWPRGRSP